MGDGMTDAGPYPAARLAITTAERDVLGNLALLIAPLVEEGQRALAALRRHLRNQHGWVHHVGIFLDHEINGVTANQQAARADALHLHERTAHLWLLQPASGPLQRQRALWIHR